MMREIKFRYVWQDESMNIFIEHFDIEEVEGISYDQGEGLSQYPETKYKLISRDEFTGLRDKNGKEIYEGDILKHGQPCNILENIFVIKWCDDSHGWIPFSRPGRFCGDCDYESDYPKYIEVIGNIHENSEFME